MVSLVWIHYLYSIWFPSRSNNKPPFNSIPWRSSLFRLTSSTSHFLALVQRLPCNIVYWSSISLVDPVSWFFHLLKFNSLRSSSFLMVIGQRILSINVSQAFLHEYLNYLHHFERYLLFAPISQHLGSEDLQFLV